LPRSIVLELLSHALDRPGLRVAVPERRIVEVDRDVRALVLAPRRLGMVHATPLPRIRSERLRRRRAAEHVSDHAPGAAQHVEAARPSPASVVLRAAPGRQRQPDHPDPAAIRELKHPADRAVGALRRAYAVEATAEEEPDLEVPRADGHPRVVD